MVDITCWNNPLLLAHNSLHWHHNERDDISNHEPHDCLLSSLFGRSSMKTSKLRVTGLGTGNSLVTGEFPAQMASNAENVSIGWHYHVLKIFALVMPLWCPCNWGLKFLYLNLCISSTILLCNSQDSSHITKIIETQRSVCYNGVEFVCNKSCQQYGKVQWCLFRDTNHISVGA